MAKVELFTKEKTYDKTIVTINLTRGTMDTAPELREYMMELIEEGERFIIGNLSKCEFMDSSFLGALVAVLKKLKSINGDFKIVFSKKTPDGILNLTKMDNVFSVYPSVEEAINSFD
jgi:anti-anti-sigma factor